MLSQFTDFAYQQGVIAAAHLPKVPFAAAFISQPSILGWVTYTSRLTGVKYRLVPVRHKYGLTVIGTDIAPEGYLLYVGGVLVDKNVRTKDECLMLIELDNYP